MSVPVPLILRILSTNYNYSQKLDYINIIYESRNTFKTQNLVNEPCREEYLTIPGNKRKQT